MHYFTLFDLKARGFVRPFYFGYVSHDHVKIDHYAEFFISEFRKVYQNLLSLLLLSDVSQFVFLNLQISQTIKYTNRLWFIQELGKYLEKLRESKDRLVADMAANDDRQEILVQSDKPIFFLDNGDYPPLAANSIIQEESVTLGQIAHQFSEIENILRIVQTAVSMHKALTCMKHSRFTDALIIIVLCCAQVQDACYDQTLDELSTHIPLIPESPFLPFLQRLSISLDKNELTCLDVLNFPLIHPLKPKGESLRPLTTLGQLGSVYLIRELLKLYEIPARDLLFSTMTELTDSFRQHCTSSNFFNVSDSL